MLSQQFRISGTALKSCFRQVYGVPIHQYLLEQRMAQAAELLTTTTQSVLQISYSSRIFQRQPVRHRVQAALPYASSQFRRNANKNPFATVSSETDRKV
ncbi:MAG: helix-turn-helix domain-containing protein [Subdoligranulum sp.]